MKKIIYFLLNTLAVISIIAGLYIGFWICFIGGSWDILEMIPKPEKRDKLIFAYSVFKIICCWVPVLIFSSIARILSDLAEHWYVRLKLNDILYSEQVAEEAKRRVKSQLYP